MRRGRGSEKNIMALKEGDERLLERWEAGGIECYRPQVER